MNKKIISHVDRKQEPDPCVDTEDVERVQRSQIFFKLHSSADSCGFPNQPLKTMFTKIYREAPQDTRLF